MTYRVRHETVYQYADPVAVAHHVLRLTPRHAHKHHIAITPAPPVSPTTHQDYFGNTVTSFGLQETHERLVVEASSELEVPTAAPPDLSASPPWELVRETLPDNHNPKGLSAYQFVFDSVRVSARADLARYAELSFTPARPFLEAVNDLTHRIHQDFRFDTKATEVSTSVETFFEKRRGVCQDFSHLQIACLRSLGLPARYVSGYLRTLPPKGRPRLIGADASHAWCSAWCPANGWIDFDPTNDCIPTDGHITVAWGRDYADVSPIHGVLLGGARHTLEVGVDVLPI